MVVGVYEEKTKNARKIPNQEARLIDNCLQRKY